MSKFCCLAFLALSGCIPVRQGNTQHYAIFGFGIVSIPIGTNSPAQVVSSQSIGLSLSDQPGIKFGLGYTANTVIQVETNKNVLIEVSKRPGQPLKVQTE